jgi:hypothetical protein
MELQLHFPYVFIALCLIIHRYNVVPICNVLLAPRTTPNWELFLEDYFHLFGMLLAAFHIWRPSRLSETRTRVMLILLGFVGTYKSVHFFVHARIHILVFKCLSIYGSTTLLGPWLVFQFLDLFTQSVGLFGQGISPSQGGYLHTGQYKQNKRTQKSMPQVGFELTIPVFGQAKTFRARGFAATVIGGSNIHRVVTVVGNY